MADDLRGEAVAVVWVGWRRHPSVSFIPTTAAKPGYRDNAHGMVAKAKAGDLHLNRTVWGLRSGSESARRSDPRRNRAASSPKTGYAERRE